MTTLYHPTFASVSVEVDDDKQVPEWTEQGWRKTPLPESSAAPKPAAKSGDNTEGK